MPSSNVSATLRGGRLPSYSRGIASPRGRTLYCPSRSIRRRDSSRDGLIEYVPDHSCSSSIEMLW
jgi:hypothetical protein